MIRRIKRFPRNYEPPKIETGLLEHTWTLRQIIEMNKDLPGSGKEQEIDKYLRKMEDPRD